MRIVAVFALFTVSVLGQAPGTGVVSGVAIDSSTGKPVAGAVVTLLVAGPAAPTGGGTPPPAPAASRRGVAVTSADGRFVFREVPAGTYVVSATLDGFGGGAYGRRRINGPNRAITLTDGGRVTDANVTLWRLSSISGTVRDDRGEPAVGLSVWTYRRIMTAGRSEITFTGGSVEATDERGHYRISGLMPGTYYVVLRSGTTTWPVAMMDSYRAATTSGTTGGMTRGWAETGVIRLERTGLVIGDFMVGVSISSPQPLPGPNGTLLVHPQIYYPGAFTPSAATPVTVGSGEDRAGIDLTMPLVTGVRVSGVLMGPGGPMVNAGVRLVPVNRQDPANETPAAYGVTDGTGRFAMLGVTQGEYVVRAYRVTPSTPTFRPSPPAAGALPGSAGEMVAPPPATPEQPALFAEAPVTVGSSNVDGLTLTLQPGAKLVGRVVFDGALPAPVSARLQQIALTVRPAIGSLPAMPDARVDAEGRFSTAGYPPGRYVFTNITTPGPEWHLASIRVGGIDAAGQAFTIGASDIADVVITFTDKTMTLSGSVQAETTGDVESTVLLVPADIQAWLASGSSTRRMASTVTSASGTYQLRIALPGDYIAIALPPEVMPDVDIEFLKRWAPLGTRVSIAPGESRTLAMVRSKAR